MLVNPCFSPTATRAAFADWIELYENTVHASASQVSSAFAGCSVYGVMETGGRQKQQICRQISIVRQLGQHSAALNMHSTSTPCRLCSVTKIVCFWGELRPYANWRRIFVGVAGAAMATFFTWFIWEFNNGGNGLLAWAIGLPMSALGIVGVMAAISGCNRCVVRLYGSA
jgi:hypothetical protein